MVNPLLAFSTGLADRVAEAGAFLVSVGGHPRFPSSGIHWGDGLIVTTDHALKRPDPLSVTLPDGSVVEAKRVGRDASTDIALLRLEAVVELAVPVPAEDTVRAGELTLVAGRSVHSGVTASMGVISSAGNAFRTWAGGHLDRRVQLDMSLYPASNGGAVLDMSGRVIGMATSAFSRLGAIVIPAANIARAVEQLQSTGHIGRGYLGVGLRPVQVPMRAEPALITLSVEPGSAADRAGWLVGDILLALNGAMVVQPEDVLDALGPQSVGKTMEASILRGGAAASLVVTVGSQRGE
ncbi:MAG: trypsin-like peptidase domain-containing protein [Acidobacteria bacterium]|nr:trypsin-like peptidase domain-containing protein [Acidobacteriota bacterium]